MFNSIKILLCGYGNIGKELFKKDFNPIAKASNSELFVYDPLVENCPNKISNLSGEFDFSFLCVPTNMKSDGSADTSIVLELCRKVKSKIIVIKSTVPIDIVDSLPENVIFSPEFTGVTMHQGKHDYLVLGGDRKLCNQVAELYKLIHDGEFKFYFCDVKTAIISKYAENCFLATKVTFFNEIAQACSQSGVEYEDVRNILLADSRINSSHTIVYENQPYYDSHCLNKDVPAFISQFGLPLMKAVNQINLEMKEKFN